MKVLHVIPGLSPDLGGPAQVAMNLVWSLRQLGVDAEIATTNYGGATPMDVPLNQRVDYAFRGDRATIPVWFFPYQPPALKEFIFSTALTQWLWQAIPQYHVLDNHYLFSYAPTCAGAIARHKTIPYTVRTMGQLTSWALAQGKTKKQLYTALIERRNLQRAAAIHCTAPSEVADVRNFGITTPTLTLPLGVHASAPISDAKIILRQQYHLRIEVPIVLFLSRLHYKKRPDLLLQTLAHLKAQGQSFHAILAGSGEAEYVEKLHQLVQSLGLTQQVSFPGLVTGTDKDLLLQGSDIFVLPSFSENFGIAVAEALVAGLSVVITPGIQIAPEIEQAEAGLVVPGEVQPLADAIAQLLNCPTLRAKLGSNGQQLAQTQYSWPVIAQHLAVAYQLIIEHKSLLNFSTS